MCADINECEETNDTCSFRCVNVPGSYQCVCPRGFALADDKKHCEDINECLKPNICPYRCKNIVGGFRCMCLEGYDTDRLERCIGNKLYKKLNIKLQIAAISKL